MKPVSASTEKAIRAALGRLAAGNAMQTDGRLTVANLAREAGVSRATANRAPLILSDLRDMVKTQKQVGPEPPPSPRFTRSETVVRWTIWLPSMFKSARC